MRSTIGRLRLALAMMLTVFVVGTIGYIVLGLSPLDAMYMTVLATLDTSIVGSGAVVPLACGMPVFIFSVISVPALPISIWHTAMSYLRPSSEPDLVSPVTACLVDV